MTKRILILAALLALSPAAGAALVCANDTYAEHATWYVGQPLTVFDQIDLDGDVWCEANGAELAYVKANLSGLRQRVSKAAVFTRWTGEDAVFILDNL